MQKSLLKGLSESDMQAIVNTFDLNDFYYPSLFPLQFTPTLTFKALEGAAGVPIAADVVAYDASGKIKSREAASKITGSIPKIEIAYNLTESQINEYNEIQFYANQGNASARKQLVNLKYGDAEKVFKGINARLEWMAMQALSLGKISLTKSNNDGVITETAVDFLIPSAQKTAVTTVWSIANKATCTPITDIRARVKAAKALGFKVKYILMNQDTFDIFRASTEVINFAANWVLKATSLAQLPRLEDVNTALTSDGLPIVRVIDTLVTTEINGTRTVVNPWDTGKVTFLADLNVGNTYYGPSAYETNKPADIMQVKREHVLIQKYSTPSPLVEYTKGISNSIPVLAAASRVLILNTSATSFE